MIEKLGRSIKAVFAGPDHWAGKDQPAPSDVNLVAATPDERRAALSRALMHEVQTGGNVVAQSEFEAVIERKRPVNNVAHAILSIITCGLWLIVWLLTSLGSKSWRQRLYVDEFGRVLSGPGPA